MWRPACIWHQQSCWQSAPLAWEIQWEDTQDVQGCARRMSQWPDTSTMVCKTLRSVPMFQHPVGHPTHWGWPPLFSMCWFAHLMCDSSWIDNLTCWHHMPTVYKWGQLLPATHVGLVYRRAIPQATPSHGPRVVVFDCGYDWRNRYVVSSYMLLCNLARDFIIHHDCHESLILWPHKLC